MHSARTLYRKARYILLALLLVTPAVVMSLGSSAQAAAQLTNRSIRMTTSVPSNAGGGCTTSCDVTYNVGFTTATTNNVGGLVVDFCSDSPLIGATCTAPTDFNTNKATLALGTQVGITGFAVDTTNSTASKVVLTRTAGSISSGTAVTIPLGTSAASDGLRNPSAVGTFYARILTFATGALAQAYTSGTPGTYVDGGGVALSTARQITINARVQEQLSFCVAAIPATVVSAGTAPANCSDSMFNGTNQTVDIGVVSNSGVSVSPVPSSNGGNDLNGGVMISTNAANGATISYFAEQATTGTNHLGALRVAGANCNAGSVSTDQCFISAGTTPANFQTSVTGEKFGMTAGKVLRPTGSTTTNLTRNANYQGNGTATTNACVAATPDSDSCFAWDESGNNDPAATLATSSTVLDWEMLVLNFAARAAATTPTGAYTVTSTYIATATF